MSGMYVFLTGEEDKCFTEIWMEKYIPNEQARSDSGKKILLEEEHGQQKNMRKKP